MPDSDSAEFERHLSSPVRSGHHLAKALHPSPHVIKEAMGEVDGFNAKFAAGRNRPADRGLADRPSRRPGTRGGLTLALAEPQPPIGEKFRGPELIHA
jgi:hypothetical protein